MLAASFAATIMPMSQFLSFVDIYPMQPPAWVYNYRLKPSPLICIKRLINFNFFASAQDILQHLLLVVLLPFSGLQATLYKYFALL